MNVCRDPPPLTSPHLSPPQSTHHRGPQPSLPVRCSPPATACATLSLPSSWHRGWPFLPSSPSGPIPSYFQASAQFHGFFFKMTRSCQFLNKPVCSANGSLFFVIYVCIQLLLSYVSLACRVYLKEGMGSQFWVAAMGGLLLFPLYVAGKRLVVDQLRRRILFMHRLPVNLSRETCAPARGGA